MIIGDPYKFSVFVHTIKEWNIDETFCNGILLFCIDGNYFPKEVVTATLKCELPPLQEKLTNPTVDERLYSVPVGKAFAEIYNRTFPEDISVSNDYSFDISPESFIDSNCFVFAVSNGEKVRIMASKLEYIISESRHNLNNVNITETYITVEELKNIALELNNNSILC